MNFESLFSGLRKDLHPDAKVKRRIERSVHNRITSGDALFADIKRDLAPQKDLQKTVWNRIAPAGGRVTADTLQEVKNTLTPSESFRRTLRDRLLLRLKGLEPVHPEARGSVVLKWIVQASPMLFMASPTVAKSEVLLLPTRGEVSISVNGMWQKIDQQLVLEPGMMLRTHDGEASIIFHDDGVVRLAEDTTVHIDDLLARLDATADMKPILTLYTGKIWIQGLVPAQLPGLTVASSYGTITVNKGSVSIAEDDVVDIEVYDRSATVTRNGEDIYLASGERTQLVEGNSVALVKKIPNKWYQYTWASQNLQRDAVHRDGIAQQQHERRIAQAGILPTSRLYPVKRFAELMDVMMTFDDQTRVEKRLQLAETRLNEAAALIDENEEQEADTALLEYKTSLQAISDDYKDGDFTQYLVTRAIAESAAQYSAIQPGDDSYLITKTVLETSADLPTEDHAQGTLLLDGLTVLVQAVDQGHTDLVEAVWSDMQPYLSDLQDDETAMKPSMYKEAKTLLSFLATSLQVAHERGVEVDSQLLNETAIYLPPPKDTSSVVLSEDDIMNIVMGIKTKIFLYHMTQPRINQFVSEMKALEGHPDEGRILRRLAQVLPDGPESFPDKVYKQIVKLRWENAGATL